MIALVVIIGKCRGDSPNDGEERFSQAETDCVLRGTKYFTEIDSYPKLSDGRDAFEVAVERCKRTTTAF